MSRRQKENLIRIITSAIIFIVALIIPVKNVKMVLYMAAYLTAGYDVLWGAVNNIIHGHVFDEDFLMAIATVGAICVGDYPEAVFVMVFFQTGELFQSIAVGKSRKSISALMDIAPEKATVFKEGEFVEMLPEEVSAGDTLLIKPGEKIPVDGVIIKGESDIDTSNMTGESIPSFVKAGDRVISGCVNMSAPIEISAEKEYGESTVAKILELVEHSAMNKGRYENFITRFSRVYTPVVVVLALLVAFVPPIFTGDVTTWVIRALSFLVVSCPCALVISVPLSFFGGIGAASKRGVLVKGSVYLEILSKCAYVVTDKTGTLTEGKLYVEKVEAENKDELLSLCGSLEKYSNHPVAKAIVKSTEKFYNAEDIREIPGKGIIGSIDGKTVIAGKYDLLKEMGIDVLGEKDGIFVACDKVYMGRIIVSDKIKDTTPIAIKTLKDMGIKKTVMLTGDNKKGAEAVFSKAGLDEMYCSLLPDEKVKKLEEFMESNTLGTTIYLGDGINDAPVLKRADAGIAMGELGSDAAIESSDIVFMNDDLNLLPESIKIARKTISIVKENIIFSISVKVLVLLLTALGYSNMWQAVFADVGVMVIAVMNTMRTLKM
ncbi:MAG: heavy metal translocating P-type ATPase [Clostridia bacterium]